MPIGDGRIAQAVVIDYRGKLVDVAARTPDSATVERAVCARRAFADQRWRRRDAAAALAISGGYTMSGVVSPGAFERRLLAGAGGPQFTQRLHVAEYQRAYRYADGAQRVRIDAHQRQKPKPDCEVLDIAGVRFDSAQVSSLEKLRALRIARVEQTIDLDALRTQRITTLALEHVTVRDFTALSQWTHLEQLELRGFWQYNVHDVQWLADFPALRRLTLDLGGRRKNAEIYRGLRVAHAWPFDLILHSA